MRASRLVTLALLLQARGPWTAEELAERLGVSARTIHRDVDALRRSGVPVQGERGPAGGYRLPGGHRTRLTGLTPDEAEALFVAPPADALGLGGFLADAQLKLLAALPPQLRERADHAAHRFHVDHGSWFRPSEPPPWLAAIAGALWRDRRLRIAHRGRELDVDPLGLVLKGPTWYLIAATARGERTFRVDRIEGAAELDAPAARPPAFDLAAHWATWSRAFEEQLPFVAVRVRVDADALGLLRAAADSRRRHELPERAPDGAASLELDVWFERLDYAESELLRLGGAVEVLSPPSLRARMATHARAMAARYDGG
ncbi:helix-turn-helix transcriptional regulator [Conexibacter arvalis]|uniref:Putative DNA-binding transcriptional regulator YafY n=1 Tax=Conexibacter arvalis TaxID=912552 RepID=A0A840IMN6_9ACTN|nr:WYL domain-containing protein [Conexibacter arvalis]MBB4665120.1 putative DNA-binding transcriptional regulator YafY [Conexibacter arvalis]